MSEVMTPMSFEQLVEWVLKKTKKRGKTATGIGTFSGEPSGGYAD